jgi:FAD-dependent urate hydroxylase
VLVRVVVAGAGIGGLATAHALIARGHEVTVVEEAPELRTGGAAISLWSNGHVALRRLGLTLPPAGERVESLRVLRYDGAPLYELDAAALERRLGAETRLLRRRDLVEHLLVQLPDGVVEFGRPVERVSPGPALRMTVAAGGADLVADLVVGADGHRSGVRRYVHDTGPAQPTGLTTWQGVHPVEVDLGRPGQSLYIQGPEGWCGLMPAGDGHVQWWFDLPDAAAQAVAPRDRTAFLAERFAQWADPVPAVVAQVDGTEVEPWPYTWHPVPRRLFARRAVLIGDSAHAMPPSLAQGASQTLDDAWALVDALTKKDDLDEALRDYQRRRRWRAALVSRLARSRFALYGPPRWAAPLGRRVPAAALARGYAAGLTLVSDCVPRSARDAAA